MDRTYWEKIAPSYNDEIFDVLLQDRKKSIISAIKKFSSKQKTVIDIGCAIGKWIPVLSPLFKTVYAIDISAKNLEIAKKNHSSYKNVKYIRVNMSDRKAKIPKCDFAICINAILTSSLKDRTVFFTTLSKCLKKEGHIVITVPSLESTMLAAIINNQFRIDKNILDKKMNENEAIKKWNNIRQGNVDIDSVPTKHYLKEELSLLLTQAGFKIKAIEKIEYNWDTEFTKPPRWLKDPYPWDWMVLAEKK